MARVTLIESPGSPLLASEAPVAPEELTADCQHLSWSNLRLDDLSACRADLLMAVAVPEPPDAGRVFRWLAEHPVRAPTFAVLPDACGRDLLRAAARAVDDFVLWPARAEELRQRIARIGFPTDPAVQGLIESMALAQMVGRDPTFLDVLAKLPRVAAADAPVLIAGETGTGKELCARALHFLGRRRAAPFIPLDCGALPDSLFESEVFGHVRGAFTDARSDQRGLVAMADGGTLFLDEVDALSPGAQAKILRLLEAHTYRPLGARQFAHADVTVISATNQDLERLVHDGRFRPDLFFRLTGLRLRLPPLRERPHDIELLARHFLAAHQRHDGTPPKVLSDASVRALEGYHWPGNVRELVNVVRGAVVLSPRRQILPEDLALPAANGPAAGGQYRDRRARVVAAFERDFLEDLLRRHRGNLTHAAREAGQDRRALGRLARKHAIDPETFH